MASLPSQHRTKLLRLSFRFTRISHDFKRTQAQWSRLKIFAGGQSDWNGPGRQLPTRSGHWTYFSVIADHFFVNAESLRWRQTGLVVLLLSWFPWHPRPVQRADGWSVEKRIPDWSMDRLKEKICGWDSCTVLSPKNDLGVSLEALNHHFWVYKKGRYVMKRHFSYNNI